MDRLFAALGRWLGRGREALVESAFRQQPPPQRGPPQRPAAAAEPLETKTTFLVWTNPGCSACAHTLKTFRKHSVPFKERTGGIDNYMSWAPFRKMLADWPEKTKTNPVRNAFPIIVAETHESGTHYEVVGSYLDWSRAYAGTYGVN